MIWVDMAFHAVLSVCLMRALSKPCCSAPKKAKRRNTLIETPYGL